MIPGDGLSAIETVSVFLRTPKAAAADPKFWASMPKPALPRPQSLDTYQPM